MKKFLIALSIILLLVALYFWYKLKQANVNLLMPLTSDSETISQLENEWNSQTEDHSDLQSENQLLKDALSWAMESINSLKAEKLELEESLSWCKNRVEKYVEYIQELREENNSNVWNNVTNTSNGNSTSNNTTTTNSKEVWIIKQIYNDSNWNRKLEIDYVQLRWYGENGCEYPLCIVNENPKLRTFTVSNNVQIVTKTLSYEGQIISFDFLKGIFNDTNNSYNEYQYLKDIPFRITIENDVIVKIEEQYVS